MTNFNKIFKMISITKIEAAHSKVESGKDFPNFAKALKEMGISTYETMVEDGHTIYKATDGSEATTAQKYKPLLVFGIANPAKFVDDLRSHQKGETDFFQFCKDCADSGIEKWIVDLQAKTCTYFDKNGISIFEEKIPG